jgi:putative protein-disulfide isomerase
MSTAQQSLLYVGDPMCSWCYGFAVPLAAVLDAFPQCPVDLIMGGLRAYNTQCMDEPLKDSLRHHWAQVHLRSGQPFDADTILQRSDFVYDTEPACRAVVTVREHAPACALDMYEAIAHAFYARGEDVTRTSVLAALWADVRQQAAQPPTLDDKGFLKAFGSQTIRDTTREDFELTQRWGVSGFPALFAVVDGQAHAVARGYTEADDLIARIEQIFSASAVPDEPVP